MPLMTSPIDGSPMKEIERYGIKLDMCQTSGGIWFDKGEIEKLIYFVREEAIKEQNNRETAILSSNDPEEGLPDRTPRKQNQKRKRENPLSELMQLFEF